MAGSRIDGHGGYRTRGVPQSAWSFRTQRRTLPHASLGRDVSWLRALVRAPESHSATSLIGDLGQII